MRPTSGKQIGKSKCGKKLNPYAETGSTKDMWEALAAYEKKKGVSLRADHSFSGKKK